MLWASLFCDEGNNNKLNWFITGAPFDSHEDSVHSLLADCYWLQLGLLWWLAA